LKFKSTNIPGCYFIHTGIFNDKRGRFTKLYKEDSFQQNGIRIPIKEQFFTLSHKNVLRGMHFQLPPYDHSKIVTCISGSILDVVLDLRVNSPSYGKCESFELSGNSIFIPSGVAHGFLSLVDNSIVFYNTSTLHMPDYDSGIHWDSFNFNWPCKSPIVSNRDKDLITFQQFDSPFIY
jgi:dTDP-4-dehydrorhamnose 3,5-epimerase